MEEEIREILFEFGQDIDPHGGATEEGYEIAIEKLRNL